MLPFARVTIIGLGLIGSSVARAVRDGRGGWLGDEGGLEWAGGGGGSRRAVGLATPTFPPTPSSLPYALPGQ